MRLIDADALERTLVEAQAECKKNGGNFRFGVLSNVRANVADAPTIAAIPVDWMRQEAIKDDGLINSIIRGLLMKWQKEQETRNESKV